MSSKLVALTGRGSVRLVPFPPEQQLIEIGNCYLSCHKIEKVLGWRPRISWQQGLARTVDFYRANLKHYLDPHDNPLPRSNAAAQGNLCPTKTGEARARPPVSGPFIHGAEQLHAALKFMLRSLVVRLLDDAD